MSAPVLFSRLAVSLAVLAILPPSGRSQGTEPAARSPEFLETVLQAPALSAAARRAVAARERVGAAGKLADVTVEGMGSRMVGPMDERATMWEVNVRQALPKRGERAADRERALAIAAMAEAEYAIMAGEMAADTAMALAEAEGAETRARLIERQIDRLDAVLRNIESQLAIGNGRIADRLTVQSRIATMQLMVEEERTMAADALAEARGRLGLNPEAALPGFTALPTAEINADEAAAIHAASARIEEANAMAKMARASAKPMTSFGLRFERERRAMGAADTLGLAFMTDLPFRSRRYSMAENRAADAERTAAKSDASAARFRISSALSRAERAERLALTAQRLSKDTLGRLNAEYDALVQAAGAGVSKMGESTILQIVEILEKTTDTALQVIQAETAARIARAELWRFAPASHFPTNS
ncbi:MAG: hypothetical protein F9K30_23100 [Dechloromonas sp.]|nr:MAG: hypothetical protein F9K30_23100 [Dechloromonas sp.]